MNTETSPALRFPLKIEVEYRHSYAREEGQAVLRNISLTGAFLESEIKQFHPKEKLKLTFKVSGRVRTIHANVIWVKQSGAGIQFLPFNNQDRQIVDDLIYFIENQTHSRRNLLINIFDKVIDKNDEDEGGEEAA